LESNDESGDNHDHGHYLSNEKISETRKKELEDFDKSPTMDSPLTRAIIQKDHAYSHHNNCNITNTIKILKKETGSRSEKEINNLVKLLKGVKFFADRQDLT
jgi:hypothetical protein